MLEQMDEIKNCLLDTRVQFLKIRSNCDTVHQSIVANNFIKVLLEFPNTNIYTV